jgi:isopropylmalate/homocitrate/citramalate synthase
LDDLLHDYIQENINQGTISLPKTIRILDATLTEGEQCPGLAYTPDEKLSMAEALADAGVHAAFIGFPIVSREEKEAARRIIREDLGFETWGLCRVIKSARLTPTLQKKVENGSRGLSDTN